MNCRQIDAPYYCGADLHARTTRICVMDRDGKILLSRNLANNFEKFKALVKPFLPELAVGAESTFSYYWLADGCHESNIDFYLGHAAYMKAISGNKNKSDRIDAKTIANLLRTSYFPESYPYPKRMRATRDLLRRRKRYVMLRAEAYTHIQIIAHQNAIAGITSQHLKNADQRSVIINCFDDEDLRMMIASDFDMIDYLTPLIGKLELQIRSRAKHHNHHDYITLQSIPGVGPILALTILYETHDITRFKKVQDYSSYCRVVKCLRTSVGKRTDSKNQKIGNPYLKWAFSQVILAAQRHCKPIDRHYQKLVSKYGKARAKARLAHKFAVAAYFMLKNGSAFDEALFLQGGK